MRTLLFFILMCLFFDGSGQNNSTHTSTLCSVEGRFYVMGESPYPVEKLVSISICDSLLILKTDKTTTWPLRNHLENVDDDGDTTEVYSSVDGEGIPMTIRMLVSRGYILDVAFCRDFISYHFFIVYPRSL